MNAREEKILKLAEAIADGASIDWEAAGVSDPDLNEAIRTLRIVERVVSAHRPALGQAHEELAAVLRGSRSAGADLGATVPASSPAGGAKPLGPGDRWGPLQLVEAIGEGRYSVVFRAFDPKLQHEVALKVLRAPGSPEPSLADRFFAEAQLLARVRHPNILRVYGADLNEGRIGIWTELVRGHTLEDLLLGRGCFGAREAALLGIDLCGALAAIHQAGLLHRDLKARNVMREEGGRVVLMDFGSVEARPGLLGGGGMGGGSGTPLATAPEVIRGEAASPATDVYGMGALLYHLVSGSYPIVAATHQELVEKHSRGESTPLREARPDLPVEFVRVVERALAPSREDRYPGAGALEQALIATLKPRWLGSTARKRWFERSLPRLALAMGAGVFAAVAAVGIWRAVDQRQAASGHPAAPPAAVKAAPDVIGTVILFRKRGETSEPVESGAEVATGDALFLEYESDTPTWVYVINEDAGGDLSALFPQPGLDLRNPLPPGERHRLPGKRGGSPERWVVTDLAGWQEIFVVASRSELRDLEREIARLPRVAPASAPALHAMLHRLVASGEAPTDIRVWHVELQGAR